mmetsp:Transcript_18290/g.62923  ORF Transcript_18290/g.62923 Transcript_18290/m.62923 type:complete len:217 (-) Transcript_18290:2763-3413(-)
MKPTRKEMSSRWSARGSFAARLRCSRRSQTPFQLWSSTPLTFTRCQSPSSSPPSRTAARRKRAFSTLREKPRARRRKQRPGWRGAPARGRALTQTRNRRLPRTRSSAGRNCSTPCSRAAVPAFQRPRAVQRPSSQMRREGRRRTRCASSPTRPGTLVGRRRPTGRTPRQAASRSKPAAGPCGPCPSAAARSRAERCTARRSAAPRSTWPRAAASPA